MTTFTEQSAQPQKKSPIFIIGIIALLVFLALLVTFWFVVNRQDIISQDEKQSLEYLQASDDVDGKLADGQFEDAADAARAHQRKYANDPYGYLAEATAYLHQSVRTSQQLIYIEIAYDLIQKALAIDSQNADAYRLLAHIHELKMEFEQAFEMYNKAILFNAEDDAAYASRGHLYYITGNDILAEDDYKKALEINANNGKALTNLALLYIRTGQSGSIDVEEILLRAIEVEENKLFLAEAYNALGVYYLIGERYEEAIKVYQQALEHDENMVPAWNGIAMSNIYLLQDAVINNVDAAEGYFIAAAEATETMLSLNENFARGYVTEGLLIGFGGDPSAQKTAYEKGLQVIDSDMTLGMTEKDAVRDTLTNLLNTF